MSESGDRIVTGLQLSEDAEVERSLRPKRLEEFIGQQHICENLAVFISAARERGEALDHVLLKGPPGLGKKL